MFDTQSMTNFPPFLADFTGTGTLPATLTLTDTNDTGNTDTIAAGSTPLSGTITYDFTPAAAIPEPTSLALLATSLISFALLPRRRRRQ